MKVRRITNYSLQLAFPNFDDRAECYLKAFSDSELGAIHSALPWDDLVVGLGLKESKKGPSSIFSPRGKLALMFLKHYAGCSDAKLIEQLNGNIYYQIFCDVLIDPAHPIQNTKIVSAIRCELGEKIKVDEFQRILANAWRGDLSNKSSMTMDATCYESFIRYPTDLKLLWEAVNWNHRALKIQCKIVGQKMLRTKFTKWKKRYAGISKSRNPRRNEKRAVRRGLLKLLKKIHEALVALEEPMGLDVFTRRYVQRRQATGQVLEQQWAWFFEEKKPTNRIVSLDKPYVRPIVRGKEKKPVEFGAKVHKIQIDGISFVEHLSFDAFNEGTRFQSAVFKAQELTHTKVKVVGADAIYATNENRNYASGNGLKTDFVRKGPRSKHHEQHVQLAHMITKERASSLEDSFGTDKEHFLLKRIKARTQKTEIIWILFGIHTSNALKIGRRRRQYIAQAA